MISALNAPQILRHQPLPPLQIWSIITGLLLLYIPTYINLAANEWSKPQHMHGFIILLVILGIFWKDRGLLSTAPAQPSPLSGWLLLGSGLLLYVLGRSQDILLFEVGSQIPVLSGIILLHQGKHILRKFCLPILFIIFLIPLPSVITDSLTLPLKQYISQGVEGLLYWLGYPIARSGVVLSIGAYDLLIADACSGLNSIFSLTAIGILFIYLRGRVSTLHNCILLASIIPIAFSANGIRVISLVLITYYLGEAAGQGFLHDLAGMMEFTLAVICLLALDTLLATILYRLRARQYDYV